MGWPIAAGDAMISGTTAKMRSGASMITLWSQFGSRSKRPRCVGNAAQDLPTFDQDNRIFLPAGDEDRALNCGQRSRCARASR